ncbi:MULTISPECIES: lipopolysaccharide transport periplasmic protein LptA [Roseobacteraceae]|jgi:lipopolysaccharide export system protein LptA|nr:MULTISPECIES: lipopolysaccharide transport periplasmic protein LptA [Roseobacteraceae]
MLLSGAAPVLAQGTNVAFGAITQDTTLPVEVTADNLSVDQSSGTAVFSGDVLIGQGEMRLTAQRVLVTYRSQNAGIAKLQATGGVTLVTGADAAEADRADYNIDTGEIEMTGDVLLTQGASALTSEKMFVNLRTGTARMSGRVKTILQTGNN